PVQAFACGKVVAAAPDPANPPALPALPVAAELASVCMWKQLIAGMATATCPDPAAVVDCADTHCDFRKCIGACADHVACVEKLADPCDPAHGGTTCPVSSECNACQLELTSCVGSFCLPLV